MIDSLRADALGSYGAGADASPNLDALGQEGVIFDQFITSASWTRASTASLFSSRFPSSHGCESKKAVLSDSVVTLAESLSNAGFATGGLPDNANISGSVGFSQGFSWYPYLPRYPFYAAESSFSLSLYSLLHRFYVRLPIKKKIEDYYLPAPAQLAKAQEFIEANQNSRWFLFIHLMDPHDPYFRHPWDGDSVGRAATSAPEASQKDQIKELYAGEVHYLDEALGEFIDWLQRSGRYDSSLIIVTSDHGEEFLEHGGWWHGSTLYDEQIRVPLLIKLPAGERAGIRVPWQVHQVDIAPTITELAGIGAGEGWQGQSLFGDDFDSKLAFGNPNAEEDPQGEEELPSGPVVVGWEQHPASREAISEQDFEGYRLRSIRWKGAKYIETLAAPPGNARNQLPQSLYDLLVDPAEQTTLIGQGNPKEAELKDRLDRELEEIEQGALPKGSREISCSEAQVLVQLGYLPELPPACLQGP
jgi:arylsulfatase A-like enzyme